MSTYLARHISLNTDEGTAFTVTVPCDIDTETATALQAMVSLVYRMGREEIVALIAGAAVASREVPGKLREHHGE